MKTEKEGDSKGFKGFASILSGIESGDVTVAEAKRLANENGLTLFSHWLASPFDPDEASWSPKMAMSWIAYRDLEKVNEVSDKRSRIIGFWRKDDGPPRSVTELEEGELLDFVGSDNYADPRTNNLFVFWMNEEKPAAVKFQNPKNELWRALIAGEIAATGLKNGELPRVKIPREAWEELRFSRDAKQVPIFEGSQLVGVTGMPWMCRPDTLFLPDMQRYRRVRILADDVKNKWPVDGSDANFEAELRQAARLRKDSTVTLPKANEIAKKIGWRGGIFVEADVKEVLEKLDITAKKGRPSKSA